LIVKWKKYSQDKILQASQEDNMFTKKVAKVELILDLRVLIFMANKLT